jgi:hypothetical protein
MPKGPPPPWKARAPHTVEAEPYFLAAVRVGVGVPLLWTGIESRDKARDAIRGLYNNAHKHNPRMSIPMPEIIADKDGTFTVKFHLVDKNAARAHQVTVHGTDRSAWAYDPRAKKGST